MSLHKKEKWKSSKMGTKFKMADFLLGQECGSKRLFWVSGHDSHVYQICTCMSNTVQGLHNWKHFRGQYQGTLAHWQKISYTDVFKAGLFPTHQVWGTFAQIQCMYCVYSVHIPLITFSHEGLKIMQTGLKVVQINSVGWIWKSRNMISFNHKMALVTTSEYCYTDVLRAGPLSNLWS